MAILRRIFDRPATNGKPGIALLSKNALSLSYEDLSNTRAVKQYSYDVPQRNAQARPFDVIGANERF